MQLSRREVPEKLRDTTVNFDFFGSRDLLPTSEKDHERFFCQACVRHAIAAAGVPPGGGAGGCVGLGGGLMSFATKGIQKFVRLQRLHAFAVT
jgi:hypothetical protein